MFRSSGGSDELRKRTTLCAWHHLRGVHAGLVRCAGSTPDALRFELGVRGLLPPLRTFAPGERLVRWMPNDTAQQRCLSAAAAVE